VFESWRKVSKVKCTFRESVVFSGARLERGWLVVNGKVKWMKIEGLKECTDATRRDFRLSFSTPLGGPSTPMPLLAHNS